MSKQQNKRILSKFFLNDFSGSVQDKFQKWFLHESNSPGVNQSLAELFDEPFGNSEINAGEHLARFKQIHIKESKVKLFRKRLSRIAAVLLLPLAIGILSLYIIPSYMSSSSQSEMLQVSAEPGKQISITLEDGSVVWLNSGSVLIYPKKFKGRIRAIHLIGEARFQVKKNTDKPFIVKTNHQNIEALGTVFTVKAYANSQTVVTRLEEGLISLTSPANDHSGYLLHPDQESVYNYQTGDVQIKSVDAVKLGLWYDGQLNFESASFDEVIEAISLQYDVQFIYDPSLSSSNLLNVKFHKDEPLDVVLEILISLTDYSGYQIYGKKVHLK